MWKRSDPANLWNILQKFKLGHYPIPAAPALLSPLCDGLLESKLTGLGSAFLLLPFHGAGGDIVPRRLTSDFDLSFPFLGRFPSRCTCRYVLKYSRLSSSFRICR